MQCPSKVSPDTHPGTKTEDAPNSGAFPLVSFPGLKTGDFWMERLYEKRKGMLIYGVVIIA